MAATKPDGGPAFPAVIPIEHSAEQGKDYPIFTEAGMSLRDYFAGQAVMSLVAEIHLPATSEPDWSKVAARQAYELADAMIAERSK